MLSLFVILFLVLNFIFVNYFGFVLSAVYLTGHVIDTGEVSLYVEGAAKIISISEPLNATYEFGIGEIYLVNLSVSADFFVDEWQYSLYDLKHNTLVYNRIGFTPNTTLSAVRFGNKLTVYAHEDGGEWHSEEVYFYVSVPNSAPLLSNISDNIYVCEGDSLDYRFNASDFDEDTLQGEVSPKNPFYISNIGTSGYNVTLFQLYSGELTKEHVGSSIREISVKDNYNSTCCIDSFETNISVIEVNNKPSLMDLGSQTVVYLVGLNNNYSRQVEVYDIEDGYGYEGNITFDLSFSNNEDLFDINQTGYMEYTPQENHLGSYFITICVNDTALENPHENISLCLEGYESNEVCDSFTLSVTNQNRAPEILNYTPLNTSLSFEGTTSTSFSVEVTDDDSSPYNTYPDIDWYVDGVRVEHNENKSSDTYNLLFGCNVRGEHNITAVTSDGLLNDSITWDLDIAYVACPVESSRRGGGGGGGGGAFSSICNEKWVCNDWQVCQNAKRSFDAKILSPEDYSLTKELCAQNEYDERFCGFQITECFDLSFCNNTIFNVPKPSEMRVCYYTENPNCNDGITNCHSGGCELLVDCGGPCPPCPTCSDGKQNQGEAGIDCGGPCPYLCETESGFGLISYFIIILFSILILIILFILYKVISIFKFKKSLKKKKH